MLVTPTGDFRNIYSSWRTVDKHPGLLKPGEITCRVKSASAGRYLVGRDYDIITDFDSAGLITAWFGGVPVRVYKNSLIVIRNMCFQQLELTFTAPATYKKVWCYICSVPNKMYTSEMLYDGLMAMHDPLRVPLLYHRDEVIEDCLPGPIAEEIIAELTWHIRGG